MRGSQWGRTFPGWVLVWLCVVAPVRAQLASEERFELRGKVINAANGAGVSNALVQLGGSGSQVQFSGPDGSFVFTELPRGTYQVAAIKPGYFNEQEIGQAFGEGNAAQKVPSDTDATVKLIAEGIIYGRVENENGQPVEGIQVRAEMWQVMDGVKRLQNVARTLTDDEGQFRIAELKPGTYYVKFAGEAIGRARAYGLSRKKQNEPGYGSQFYPGVTDVGLATAVRIRSGSQVQITQALKPEKLYEVSGVLRGTSEGKWFHVYLTEPSGEPLRRAPHIDQKSGEFQFEGVPEGTYLLRAMGLDPNEQGPEGPRAHLTALMPIRLNRDLTGLVLMLGRGANVEVAIEDEIPVEGKETHQVEIRLVSKESRQITQALMLPPAKEDRQAPHRFERIEPGTYEVEASPNGKGYVASLRCGDLDLLRDELTIAAGAAVPPIEVKLRNDGAELDVEATENGRPAVASVVLYSEEYPKKAFVEGVNGGKASMGNLRPGAYKVVVLKGLREVEFRDPVFMEKYLAQAKEVNLRPGEKVSVRVEVQEMQEE